MKRSTIGLETLSHTERSNQRVKGDIMQESSKMMQNEAPFKTKCVR
jgi:hypothetical protein